MISPSFGSMVTREWRVLLRDPWLVSLVSWVPLLLFFLMWAIFSQGIARDLPVGVVDLDKSRTSRALVRHYDASPALEIAYDYLNVGQGAEGLRTGKIYGLVVIPEDLEKNMILGRPPQVSAFVNNQFLLIGKNVNSALLQAQGTFTAGVETVQKLAAGSPVFDTALSAAVPISTQATPLFNLNQNYAQFLVSAILPAVWQILMVAITVLSLAAENRRKGFGEWLRAFPIKALVAKFIPLILLFWLHGLLFLWIMYIFLGWPMHGNWTLLLFAQLLTVFASISAGSLFFFLTQDAARGLSLAAAYAAPALAFMGVTFPVTDMTLPARIWRDMLPISHYIEIQFGQVNYGAPLHTALPQLQHLLLFVMPLLLVFYKARQLGSLQHQQGANQ
ncbi:MAG: ABC transporter permease [Desulforhopalus sp.]